MSVIMKNGVGLGLRAGAAFMDLSKKNNIPVASTPDENPITYVHDSILKFIRTKLSMCWFNILPLVLKNYSLCFFHNSLFHE